MVLIISIQGDASTSEVIEWLVARGKDYVRIDGDNIKTKFLYYDIDKRELMVRQNGRDINLLERDSVWHRRKGFSLNSLEIDRADMQKQVFLGDHDHKPMMGEELQTLISYLYYSLETGTRLLGDFEKTSLNKLIVLSIARECGLAIPAGLIITGKQQLAERFEEDASPVITKAINEGVYKITKKYGYYSYTERLTRKDLDHLPDSFFPSLIQSEVRKKYELRVFYLKGECYAMAIFSQRDRQTTTDFRKYNFERPNRTVPYRLPAEVQQKLARVFERLSLDTGSADLIVDENNNYVFLEINPVGQFAMTSLPCNYQLERRIAEIL